MDIKKIIALAIVVLAVFSCLNAVSAGLFDFLSGDQYLEGDGSQVKIPGTYSLDDKKIVATGKDINISFTAQRHSDDKFEKEFFGAVKEFGKDAGYENMTNKTINGYTVYDFAAHPDKLKNLTAPTVVEGSDSATVTFPPEIAAVFDDPVDHFRAVTFIKDGKENKLLFFTNNKTASLYTPEIDEIINSIGPIENK